MVSEKAAQEHVERPAPPPLNAPQSEYDQYWLKYVYAADREKQLTVRALLTGCLIGGIMSFSNLYVGLKTGWGLGASITAAILAFGFFSAWQKATGSKDHFTVLENNTMQTAASAAAYMTSAGLVSAVPAMYLVAGQELGFGSLLLWITCISLLGVVAAIPVKRKLINEERLPFPSGTACAETLQSLHASGSEGTIKAQALGFSAVIGGLIALLRDGLAWLPETLATFGSALAKRTVAFEPSLVMIGAGALMGLKVTISMVVAGAIAWGIAPELLFNAGWVLPAKLPFVCSAGDVANVWGELKASPTWLASQGLVTCTPVPARFDMIGYGELTKWLLWPGVALMVTHSLTGVLIQAPKMIAGLKKTFSKNNKAEAEVNALAHVEAPMSWFMGGLLVAGTFAVAMQSILFDIPVIYGILAVILALMLSFVAARSTGETDITPVGAMGKVTQLVFGGALPGKIVPNLMAANVTGGAASQVGDLLTDMKTGHILGAKPRAQIIAQGVGILVGAVFATLAYMILINPEDLGTEKWPAPAALTWAGVAKLLSQGLDKFEWHKLYAVYIAGGVGIAFALAESVLPAKVRKWMPSVAGAGIAIMIPFFNSLSMFVGALIAAIAAKFKPQLSDRFTVVLASGVIAGETLMAVGIIAYNVIAGGGH
jgi:OPT family oligopeptide transporter